MATIVTPREFFVSERDKMYDNWTVAFWRELFSNSMDAGARSVAIRCSFPPREASGESSPESRQGAGFYRVVFADNGPGMSRETLENVYMRLGASTKGGPGQSDGVGGFGRARILTCFSQPSYRILTRDLEVRGSGGEYDILEGRNSVDGCILAIDIDAVHAKRLQAGLRHFLSQSTLSSLAVKLTLPMEDHDGNTMPMADLLSLLSADVEGVSQQGSLQWRTLFNRGRTVRDFSADGAVWGRVSINQSPRAHSHRLIVRVNGAAMYDEHIRHPAQVTLDLLPDMSRKALTASRDSLRMDFRRDVMQFIQELAVDEKSALRDRRKEKHWTLFAGGRGAQFAGSTGSIDPGGEPDAGPVPDSRKPGDQARRVDGDTGVVGLHDEAASAMAGSATAGETHGTDEGTPVEARRPPPRRLDYLPHMIVLLDNPTAAQRAVAPQYRPDFWARADAQGRGDGAAARLLLAAWTDCCRHAISTLMRNEPGLLRSAPAGSRLQFLTGFVFSSEVGAMHANVNGREILLINPVNADGRADFRLSEAADRRRLMALALHEVTHIAESWHSERYANILTELVAAVSEADIDRGMRRSMKEMREAMRDARAGLNGAGRLPVADAANYDREEHVGDTPAFG